MPSRISAEQYLNERIDKSGECWVWKLSKDKDGYGKASYLTDNNVLLRRAHRLAYDTWKEPIPEDLCVLHRCDNPPCCNPEHLFLGTIGDNNRDTFAKGRWKYHEISYHLEVIKEYGKTPTAIVAEKFNIHPGMVCKIYRKYGLTGRIFWRGDRKLPQYTDASN